VKIVIIGGTGFIGSKLFHVLTSSGHDVIAASPTTGVDILTTEGLQSVLQGTAVVVDVSNSPLFEDQAVLDFFSTAGRNLLMAEKEAGVAHHVVLSIVGAARNPDSGYMRAKVVQEQLVRDSGIPYSIVHSTQFFEFLDVITNVATKDNKTYLPSGPIQPIASDDVVAVLARISISNPLNGSIAIAGPEKMGMDEMIKLYFEYLGDPREVVTDDTARYSGSIVSEYSLVPTEKENALLGSIRFYDWANKKIGG